MSAATDIKIQVTKSIDINANRTLADHEVQDVYDGFPDFYESIVHPVILFYDSSTVYAELWLRLCIERGDITPEQFQSVSQVSTVDLIALCETSACEQLTGLSMYEYEGFIEALKKPIVIVSSDVNADGKISEKSKGTNGYDNDIEWAWGQEGILA